MLMQIFIFLCRNVIIILCRGIFRGGQPILPPKYDSLQTAEYARREPHKIVALEVNTSDEGWRTCATLAKQVYGVLWSSYIQALLSEVCGPRAL